VQGSFQQAQQPPLVHVQAQRDVPRTFPEAVVEAVLVRRCRRRCRRARGAGGQRGADEARCGGLFRAYRSGRGIILELAAVVGIARILPWPLHLHVSI
jgi:hypothetical protein